jgi:HKD family nuclease
MDIVIQNQANPGKVLLAFSNLADSDLSGLKFAVAYVTKAGSDCLFGVIKNKIGSAKWESIPKTFITSFDFGFTEPTALVSMQQIANCKVQISGKEVLKNKMLRPLYSYHPKIYIFEKSIKSSLAIGSANLSHGALTTNTEAISIYESFSDQDQLDQYWKQIVTYSEELSTSLLSDYISARKKFQVRKTKPRLLDEKPDLPAPHLVSGSLDVFSHPISIGKLSPLKYDHFWVQAGSMSSGGSANQLELPRGAMRSDVNSGHQTFHAASSPA